MMIEKYIQYENIKIFFKERGEGIPVILIHGYLETSEIWDSYAEKLSEKFLVITPDLPGHGESGSPGEILTMEILAKIITVILDKINIEKAFVAGHSLGGYVALAFADLFPGRLNGFCLFHSHPFADSEEVKTKRENEIRLASEGKRDNFISGSIEKMYSPGNILHLAVSVEKSKKLADSIPSETLIAVLKGMMLRPSRLQIMESGDIPCLWILGARDNYINCDVMKSRVRMPANGTLKILENSGHLGFIEEEERSLRILDEFIYRESRQHTLE